MACSLANLGQCLPEAFLQYMVDIINTPLESFLSFVQRMFIEPVDVSGFKDLWLIIVSVISIFYGIAFLYTGFNFLVAGFDASRKEIAKQWLRNIFLMMISVQASFWLYGLLLEIFSLLTAGVFSLIPPDFFLITADTWSQLGDSIVIGLLYVLIVVVTMLFLAVRYLIVVSGVLFFPIGLFLYFLPPLRGLGRMILWVCNLNISMTFFASLVLLMASRLTDTGIFIDQKMILLTAAFFVVDLTLIAFVAFSILKGIAAAMQTDVFQGAAAIFGGGGYQPREPNPPRPSPYQWYPSGQQGQYSSDSTG